MTDLETLARYRLQEAEETLRDAEQMLAGEISPRSVVNRAYYVMFYAVLALHLRFVTGLKTSKHAGVISLFDKEFVQSGRMDRKFSRMLHGIFELRIEGDYKEQTAVTTNAAEEAVRQAREFLAEARRLLDQP